MASICFPSVLGDTRWIWNQDVFLHIYQRNGLVHAQNGKKIKVLSLENVLLKQWQCIDSAGFLLTKWLVCSIEEFLQNKVLKSQCNKKSHFRVKSVTGLKWYIINILIRMVRKAIWWLIWVFTLFLEQSTEETRQTFQRVGIAHWKHGSAASLKGESLEIFDLWFFCQTVRGEFKFKWDYVNKIKMVAFWEKKWKNVL
jgi:hypothetical protein